MTHKPLYRRFGPALIEGLRQFNANAGWIYSSHVAMSLMLALFPFMLFVVALAGALSRDVNAQELIDLMIGTWPEEIATPLADEIRAVLSGSNGGLVTLGGLLAIYFASNGVDAIRLAISQAYRDHDPRPFWKTRALAVLFVLVGGAGVLLGLTFGVAVPAYLHFVDPVMPDMLAPYLIDATSGTALAFILLSLGVLACHIWLPGLRHGWRDIWPGVLLTMILWVAAAWGFSLYLSSFADYSATYAGLAGAMAALIFLYLMAAILILGAEVNGALQIDAG